MDDDVQEVESEVFRIEGRLEFSDCRNTLFPKRKDIIQEAVPTSIARRII